LAAYTGRELAAEPDPFGKVRELGFNAIEIAGLLLPLPLDDAGLADWSGRLRRLGLAARFHCSPDANRHFFSADAAARSESLRRTARDIEAASRLGIHSVVIHPSAANDADGRARVVEALHLLQELAARAGIGLELECASGPFNGDPRELAGLCETVPGVGIALDVAHAFRSAFCLEGAGTLADWIAIAAPCVKSIQFNDVKRRGERHVQTAVGRGDIPYDEVMPSLAALDCAWWTIELCTLQHLVESKTYLARFLRSTSPA